MYVRVPVLESLQRVDDFVVFVSYRAVQLDEAKSLRQALETLRFRVTLIDQDDYFPVGSEDELVVALRGLSNEANAVCVVLSREALESRWVRVEISEAARVLGRVLFVHDGSLRMPDSGYRFEDPAPSGVAVGLVIKHTTLGMARWDAEALDQLGAEIVTDPEEGWFDSEIPASWLARDVRAESEMVKYARRCLMADPRVAGWTIRDVMAFPQGSAPVESPEEMFQWYAAIRGRPSLIDGLRKGALDGFHASYFAGDCEPLAGLDNP